MRLFSALFSISLGLIFSCPSFLLARQTQDVYLVIDCPAMQLLYLQPYDTSIRASETPSDETTQPFALYSFSTNQSDQILSVALASLPPKDIKLLMQAEAPDGATSLGWVELSLEMKPLVNQILPGSGKDLRIYLKAESNPQTEAFDLTQVQLRYRFDRT